MWIRTVSILFLSIALHGCATYMYGYTENAAQNQMLIVDEGAESFGYKRMQYMLGFRGAGFKSFIEEKGLPDYIYEFRENDRACVALFYIQSDLVYVFKEQNWRPDSLAPTGMRNLNDLEKQRFGVKTSKALSI